MEKLKDKKSFVYFFSFLLFFVTGCSEFTGLRTPLYDGEAVEPKEEAIAAYRETGEVIGAEKAYYARYPFSEDITQLSLDFPNEEPVLLTDGTFTVGEDLSAGRATLLGNESSFSSENYDVHVGNLIIRDEAGEVYFENLFHSEYGQLTAQVDLIPGHEMSIIGTDTEITVFYSEKLPEDPYVLMDVPQVIENMGRVEVQQPLEILEDGNIVSLTAGIYEVGVHFEPGTYEITQVLATHSTEMYLFRASNEPRVFELLANALIMVEYPTQDFEVQEVVEEEAGVQIELVDGDKIYPNLVRLLQLTRVETQ